MAFSALEKALSLAVGIDLAIPGTNRKVAMALASRLAPLTVPAASAVGPYAPPAIGIGLGLGALETGPGQQLLAAAAERGRQDRIRFERMLQDFMTGTPAREPDRRDPTGAVAQRYLEAAKVTPKPRKKTTFNKAVKASYAALKKSKAYGGVGVIKQQQAAFRTATRAASARLRGRKMPKSGPSKIAYKAAKTVYSDYILRQMRKK